jgi:hypothetical protein
MHFWVVNFDMPPEHNNIFDFWTKLRPLLCSGSTRVTKATVRAINLSNNIMEPAGLF